jgi:hypothetical protein
MFEISRTGSKSMNIQTVAANLRNTIAGKELYHAGIERKMLAEVHRPKLIALKATKEFLEENIDELKRILQDVEVCCEQQMKIE